MLRIGICVTLLLLLVGCGGTQEAAKPKTPPKDPKIAAIEDRVAKTSPEGKQIIEKVKGMKPEVNGQPSGKTLNEIIDDYALTKAAYNITPLGWEASQKAANGRWKVVFNYKTYSDELLAAEWEYDPKTDKLYPYDTKNAPGFWSAPEKKSPVSKGK
jgi:hypothetical protein